MVRRVRGCAGAPPHLRLVAEELVHKSEDQLVDHAGLLGSRPVSQALKVLGGREDRPKAALAHAEPQRVPVLLQPLLVAPARRTFARDMANTRGWELAFGARCTGAPVGRRATHDCRARSTLGLVRMARSPICFGSMRPARLSTSPVPSSVRRLTRRLQGCAAAALHWHRSAARLGRRGKAGERAQSVPVGLQDEVGGGAVLVLMRLGQLFGHGGGSVGARDTRRSLPRPRCLSPRCRRTTAQPGPRGRAALAARAGSSEPPPGRVLQLAEPSWHVRVTGLLLARVSAGLTHAAALDAAQPRSYSGHGDEGIVHGQTGVLVSPSLLVGSPTLLVSGTVDAL